MIFFHFKTRFENIMDEFFFYRLNFELVFFVFEKVRIYEGNLSEFIIDKI